MAMYAVPLKRYKIHIHSHVKVYPRIWLNCMGPIPSAGYTAYRESPKASRSLHSKRLQNAVSRFHDPNAQRAWSTTVTTRTSVRNKRWPGGRWLPKIPSGHWVKNTVAKMATVIFLHQLYYLSRYIRSNIKSLLL